MCKHCFNKGIKKFDAQSDFESFETKLSRKVSEKKLKIIDESDSFEALSSRLYYQCNHCNECWVLSIPDNASRGYFLEQDEAGIYHDRLYANSSISLRSFLLILILFLILIFSLIGCLNNIGQQKNDNYWGAIEIDKICLDSLMSTVCSIQNVEVIDLYSVVDSIPEYVHEELKLVELLKLKGFTVDEFGRGNWDRGPRIVSTTMSDDSCACRIDKLYYSTKEAGRFRVTERIQCGTLGG